MTEAPLRTRHRPLPLLVAFAATVSAAAYAAPPLPQGGQFVDGQGSITRNGATLDINQTSARGIIDWRSFSIGMGRNVTIDNGSGATLNRVTGNAVSLLNGGLNATGSVYLINPNGVLVGPTGVIATGGRFVASTLDVDNDAFMQGVPLTLSGTSNGAVVNLGHIGSSGGDVFLVSNKAVANLGTIDAPNGIAGLAAGSQVLLQDTSTGRQVFVQAGSGGQALNAGAIRAAQISLQATDGNVYAMAGNHSALRATGTATRDGHVWLVADGGTVDAHGATISAQNADGSGGTVDMSADTLKVARATVNAAQWNLTAPEFTIDTRTAKTFDRNLSNGTSIAVNTTGANGATGDIGVQSDLRWNGASSLLLNAYHSVSIAPNTTIANGGAGNLTLRADANVLDNGGSVTNNGMIDWSHSTGIVSALYDMNGSYTPGTIDSNASWSAAPFSGLVTQITGYQLVNTLADLENVAQNLAGTYALGANIDTTAAGAWQPIGDVPTPFTGQFDGMGHMISNLDISYPSTDDAGLFGAIGTSGVVRNLGVQVAYGMTIFQPMGGLAGDNAGLITNSYSTGGGSGSISAQGESGTMLGGLVGENDGTIERSWSDLRVNSPGAGGGLAGVNTGTILQSYATGSVGGGSLSSSGGLVGDNTATGVINQSYATGPVSAARGGGIAADNEGTIEESFSTSSLSYPFQLKGGIAYNNQGVIASNVYWDVDATGTTSGVGNGTPVPAANGFTTAQMSDAASFGPTWDFSPDGTWTIPAGGTHPVLQWQVEH